MIFERLHHLGYRRAFLADRDVDADDISALLVDDRVERDSRLSRLAVPDDQLALSAADRDHGVDGFDSGLQGLLHAAPVHDAGGDAFDGEEVVVWIGLCRRSARPARSPRARPAPRQPART